MVRGTAGALDPGQRAESASPCGSRWRTAGSPARTRTKGAAVPAVPRATLRALPAAVPGLYLNITQLYAQIQLSVSLSPVDVRRQHLILHGHAAQRAGRLVSLRLAASVMRSWRWSNAGRKPQRSGARSPTASRRPTLAGRACAVLSGAGGGASRAGAERGLAGGKGWT